MEGFKRLLRGESNIDFVGRSRTWLLVSAIVLGVSFLGLGVRKLNLGLEFKGGSALTVPLTTSAGVADIEEALGDSLGEVDVQILTDTGGARARRVLVRTEETDEKELTEAQGTLAAAAGAVKADGTPDVDAVSRDTVGPSWGRQVSSKALRGLLVFLVLVSIYISLRFEPKMAAGALAALFHDLIATAGVYALVGFEVTPATVVALLTLMGFSLYDTVVVFDRVRENAPTVTATGKLTYSGMVNRSMNEVLIRSINTSVSSVLPVAGLLFVGVFLFGAVTLKDLALAMFIGTLVSTYSSIFVAAPLLAWLKEREPRYRALRVKLAGDAGAMAEARAVRPPAAPADAPAARPAEAASPVATEEKRERPPVYAPPAGSTPRPRKKRRGKRR